MNCPRCDGPAKMETLREFGGVCEHCLLDFAAERDAPEFPGLKILRTLGEGGMGVVYQAEQAALGRVVALKVLSPALASEPAFVERFTREAKALAQMSHPNIVGIHEFGVHDGVPYLVMEYVEGTSLRKLLKKMDGARALEIVPQICDALAYAHSRGVVHRDIKPENILLDLQGRVKIADFGLAKLAEADQTRITRTNVVMGTPHYMAPEQMENPGLVDHRADLFSLGVVFYEMLTGELPLGRFKAPSERADVDRRFDPVVLKSLERSPDDRWQSAGAMKDRITTLKEEEAPTIPWMTSRPSRNRWAVASIAALACAAVLGLFGAMVPGAAWVAVLSAAALPLLAALGLAIVGIVKAPRGADGRRVGIFPAVVTLCVLGALALVPLVLAFSSWKRDVSALTAVTACLMAAVVGSYFLKRRSLIQTAWFLLAAALGLEILSMELNKYGAPLELAAVGAVLGANVLAAMGLVHLRGRPAAAAKVAGLAVPLVTLLAIGGLVLSSAPATPAQSVGSISIERIGDFKVSDLWPEAGELPEGMRFGTVAELNQALGAAGVPLKDVRLADTIKPAVVMPGRVILIGLGFKHAGHRSDWERRPWEGPPARWNERRLAGDLAMMQLYYPRTPDGEKAVDALWTLLARKRR